MPHKHTRRGTGDAKNFDLAPSQTAKPLPAFEKSAKGAQKGKNGPRQQQQQPNGNKRKRNASGNYKGDDTPREFARLMQYQQSGEKRRSGLDDGVDRRSKKRRKVEQGGKSSNQATGKITDTVMETAEKLKILPGERLRDFAARVNQALPVSGLARKGKQVDGMKERQTKTEKRLHKMYADWRLEEQRRKDKLEELQEQQEEEDEEQEAALGGQSVRFPTKRKRMVGEADDDDEDPWAVLKSRREAPKGLHDVVQAPPTMKVVPKEKFKVSNGAKINVANVPGAAGSLKRREELGEARKEVIDRYRAMMKGNGKT